MQHYLNITGMHCAACVARVEKQLNHVAGVSAARVNLLEQSAVLDVTPDFKAAQVQAALAEIGYGAKEVHANNPDHEHEHNHASHAALWACGFLILAVLEKISMLAGTAIAPAWVQAAVASLAVWVLGRDIIIRSVKALRHGQLGMDSLVALGVVAAFTLSLIEFARGSTHLYFSEAVIILVFIALGHALEDYVRHKTESAMAALSRLRPIMVTRLGAKGDWVETPVADIIKGDVIQVRAGQVIGVDGRIVQGAAAIDASALTGESLPLHAGMGDMVFAGCQNLDGLIDIKTTSAGTATRLDSILGMMRLAGAHKPALQKTIDQVTQVFVPVVLVVAALTLGGWWLAGARGFELWLPAIAVLVMACPCALGLATPTVLAVAASAAARRGVLLKEPARLENLARVTTVVFDKTGTLTQGKPDLVDTRMLGDEKIIWGAVAALTMASHHPHSKILAAHAASLHPVMPLLANIRAVAGQGVEGYAGDVLWRLGSIDFVGGILPDDLAARAASITVLSMNGRSQAFFVLHDTVRSGAAELITRLKARGLNVVMLSGDRVQTVKDVAGQVGIDNFYAAQSPENKLAWVEAAQKNAQRILMVGDGVNDSLALKRADFSLAMGGGVDAAAASADACLLNDNVGLVDDMIIWAQATRRNIGQNLFWAGIYNVIGLPLAAFGVVPPIYAALTMSLSSVSVVVNALRLKRVFIKTNDNRI